MSEAEAVAGGEDEGEGEGGGKGEGEGVGVGEGEAAAGVEAEAGAGAGAEAIGEKVRVKLAWRSAVRSITARTARVARALPAAVMRGNVSSSLSAACTPPTLIRS